MPAAPPRLTDASICYDLEATILAVHTATPALHEGMDYFIGERRMIAPRAPTFQLHIGYGSPQPPPDEAQILYQGPLLDEGMCVFCNIADAYMLSFPGAATLTIHLQHRTAEIVVA